MPIGNPLTLGYPSVSRFKILASSSNAVTPNPVSRGDLNFAPFAFNILQPKLSYVSPTNVILTRQQVTVKGIYFPSSFAGIVYLDENKNGQFDEGEPKKDVNTPISSESGIFKATLTIPASIAEGTYNIMFTSTAGNLNTNPVSINVYATAESYRKNKPF
jgi:hypothetical protein